MVPIVILWPWLDGGTRRVKIVEWKVSIRVGDGVAVEFANRHGLDDVKALLRAFFEIFVRVSPVEPVKQFPARVAQVKKRLSHGGDKKAMVVAHL